MSDNKSLNRGLDALLGDQKLTTTTKEIDLEKITAGRYQPRQEFDDVKIQELADSIKKHGVLSPILVREVGLDKFEVIAGERRVRASKIAGLKTIPSLINQKEDQEALEAALIENLQREDLNPVEEARGYDRLKREFELTQDEIAKAKGLRIKVIRFRSGMSYEDLANNSPLGRYAEGKLRLLNGHYPSGEPKVGDLMKIVE